MLRPAPVLERLTPGNGGSRDGALKHVLSLQCMRPILVPQSLLVHAGNRLALAVCDRAGRSDLSGRARPALAIRRVGRPPQAAGYIPLPVYSRVALSAHTAPCGWLPPSAPVLERLTLGSGCYLVFVVQCLRLWSACHVRHTLGRRMTVRRLKPGDPSGAGGPRRSRTERRLSGCASCDNFGAGRPPQGPGLHTSLPLREQQLCFSAPRFAPCDWLPPSAPVLERLTLGSPLVAAMVVLSSG